MNTVLIFDYDGVIVDSLDLFMDFFIKACKNHGWEQIATKEDFLSLFDGNMYETMAVRGMSKSVILEIVHEVRDGLLSHLSILPLFPMMKETLQVLSANFTLVISTSNDSNVVNKYLYKKEISVFSQVYGSDVHPSKIKKIQMIKQDHPADEYVYIGDTIGDIQEGKHARIKTVAVTWGWHTIEQLKKAHPDIIIESVADLQNISEHLT